MRRITVRIFPWQTRLRTYYRLNYDLMADVVGAGDYRADFGEGRQRNFQVSRAAFGSIARLAGALHSAAPAVFGWASAQIVASGTVSTASSPLP